MIWFKHYAGRNVNYGELARMQVDISAQNAKLTVDVLWRYRQPIVDAVQKIVSILAESGLSADKYAEVLREAEQEALRRSKIVTPSKETEA